MLSALAEPRDFSIHSTVVILAKTALNAAFSVGQTAVSSSPNLPKGAIMKEYRVEFRDGSSTDLIVGQDEMLQEALVSLCRMRGLHLGHVTSVVPMTEARHNRMGAGQDGEQEDGLI